MVSLARQYLVNVAASWLQVAARAAAALVFVPFAVGWLGDERYGLWVILFGVLNYFSILDGGLASALLRFVPRAADDDRKVNRILSTANLLYLASGIIALGGIYILARFGMGWLHTEAAATVDEGSGALVILGVYLMVRFWLLPYGNSLAAFQRTDLGQVLETGELLIRTAGWMILLADGGGLVALAWWVVLVAAVRHLGGIIILRRLRPGLKLKFSDFDRLMALKLYEYSRVSLGITILWIMLLQSDAILLGALFSTAAAGVYFAGAQVVHQLRLLLHAVGAPLIPALARVEAERGTVAVAEVYLRSLGYLAYLMGAAGMAIILLAESFTGLWLPGEFAAAGEIMALLAIGAVFSLPQTVGESLYFGTGRHSGLMRFLAVEVACKLGLAIWLVPTYGAIGMAWATTAPQAVLYTTVYPWMMQRSSGIAVRQVLGRALLPALAGAGLSGLLVWATSRLMDIGTWTGLIVAAATAGVICLLVGFRWVLTPEDRMRVVRRKR